jgi:CO/xanthine dehydrogenase Mo-binding subunit
MLEVRKDIFADERDDALKEIGKPTQRQDMLGHGTSTYFDDHAIAGMLHLKVLRSPHAHARIRSIDISAAERAAGVRRVIRGADVKVNLNTTSALPARPRGGDAVRLATWRRAHLYEGRRATSSRAASARISTAAPTRACPATRS